MYISNTVLDRILEEQIVQYLNKPVKVCENNYDSTKLVTFYNKQKSKRNFYKYKYFCYCIHIILFYILFCI